MADHVLDPALDPDVYPRAPRPTAINLAEPMRSRWSPSVFDPNFDLTDEQIEQLLRAAQWAPSWGNSQPWHYLVATRGSKTSELLVSTLTRGNLAWVPRVSVVFVGVIQVGTVEEKEPSPVALYDAGQAAAHITLQAQAMGLNAHQFSGFDHEAFAELIGVPRTHQVVPAIAVGRLADSAAVPGVPDDLAAKDVKPRRRRPLAKFAFEERWGQPWTGLDS